MTGIDRDHLKRVMTHLAIQESDGNGPVTWSDPVSDADYLAASTD